MKTLRETFDTRRRLTNWLPDHARYRAHLPPKRLEGILAPETLEAHVELVCDYAANLADIHGLDDVLNRLIGGLLENTPFPHRADYLGDWVRRMFVEGIVFHDFGKVNPHFQTRRMKNPMPPWKNPFEPPHGHSFPGTWLFVGHTVGEVFQDGNLQDDEERLFLVILAMLFGYSILRHHNPTLSEPFFKILDGDFLGKWAELWRYAEKYEMTFQSGNLDFLALNQNDFEGEVLKTFRQWLSENEFALFALLKLHFSLLTASDYLATGDYMNQVPIKDFGILDMALRQRLIDGIRGKKGYNRDAYAAWQAHPQTPTFRSPENLNYLRREMATAVIREIRAHAHESLFYLEAPTGGGKTNLSMLALAELLDRNKELNKVFYVFPFTTLVTQTHRALLDTAGIEREHVAELHGRSGLLDKTPELEQDGVYGSEKTEWLDHLFVHFPIVVLTHVRFFDVLKTNRKEANYLLHRLANSVVIVDEVQSYPPAQWDKLVWFIRQYARFFNIRFLLMSATLPKLDVLTVSEKQAGFITLLPDAKTRFFQNPNFCERVKFEWGLLDKVLDLEALAIEVVQKSKAYAINNSDYPDSVFTIIEFIYKKTTTSFYPVVSTAASGFFDEIFVLSGTILEPRRREIINYLKNPDNRKQKVLLVTTQVVEAGVDIDMDLGFKDTSLIDSDEQLAGRINRNVTKAPGELYLFNFDDAGRVYGKDKRFDVTRKELSGTQEHRNILENKDFDRLYRLVLEKLDHLNEMPSVENFKSFRSDVRLLNLKEVDKKFRLIDQENLTVFVPLSVPVRVPAPETDKWEDIFSNRELKFLEAFGVVPQDNQINGADIWNLFVQLMRREAEISEREADMKRMQGVLSKFTFSLLSNPQNELLLRLCSNHEKNKYGFFYLTNSNVYDYRFGMKSEADVNSELIFL